MGNVFTDIATAIKLTKEVRRARKSGATAIEFQAIREIPIHRLGYWSCTPEACLFYREEWQAIWDLFDTFDEEIQHAFTFAPKDGEWADRIRFWQRELRLVLEPKQYHKAMLILTQWAERCVRTRREEELAA